MTQDRSMLEAIISQLKMDGDSLAKLLYYIELINVWSKKTNLISEIDRKDLLGKHIIPSLLMVPLVKSMPHSSILDLGSGAGIPGIPLKMALPDSLVILVESRRKRANFLKEVIRRLAVKKIRVVNQRLEDWCNESKEERVDMVVSRAVGYNEELSKSLRSILKPGSHAVNTLRSTEYTKIEKQKSILSSSRQWQEATIKWGIWTV